jgi:hypothetical protein
MSAPAALAGTVILWEAAGGETPWGRLVFDMRSSLREATGKAYHDPPEGDMLSAAGRQAP